MAEPDGPHNVIAALPGLSFRGHVAPPYDDVSFSWTHSLAERRYPYIDAAGHDWTGRDPIGFTANLMFLNSLQDDAFPDLWEEWKAVLIEGTLGPVRHPVLGAFFARVSKVEGQVHAKTRAGIVVRVSWVETLKDPSKAQEFTALSVSVKKAAEAAKEAADASGINYPDGERTDDLTDLAGQLDGVLFSANLSISGAITQAQGIVGDMIDTTKNIDDHTVYAARDLLTQVYNGLIDLAEKAGADFARPTGTASFEFDTTLDVAAIDLGNTTTELLGLNLDLVRSPDIKAGTVIIYYTA